MNDWVTVAYNVGPVQMAVLKDRFEEEAIEYFVKDEYSPYEKFVAGGTKIQVRENDVRRAGEILKETGYSLDINDIDKPKVFAKTINGVKVCPYCGSDNIRVGKLSNFARWAFFLFLILSFFIPGIIQKERSHCFNCGKDF